MTFLSISPEALYSGGAVAAPSRAASRPLRAPLLAHCAAMVVLAATLTIPGSVAHAKWSKLNLILNQVQHRCVASFAA